MLKDLELEQANHAASPCSVDKNNENNEGENQCEQRQRQTKLEWNDAGDGDDKNRVQKTNDERDERDDTNDSQALTGGDITKYRAHSWYASVTCHKNDQISSLRQLKYAVRWQTRQRLTWGQEDWKVSSGEAASRVLVPLTAEW